MSGILDKVGGILKLLDVFPIDSFGKFRIRLCDFIDRFGKMDNNNWVWIPQSISIVVLFYYIARILLADKKPVKEVNNYPVVHYVSLGISIFSITYFILNYGEIFNVLLRNIIFEKLNNFDDKFLYTSIFSIMVACVFVAFTTNFSKSIHTITAIEDGIIAGSHLNAIYSSQKRFAEISRFFIDILPRFFIVSFFILLETKLSSVTDGTDIVCIGLLGIFLYVSILCWFFFLWWKDEKGTLTSKWKYASIVQFSLGFLVCVFILLWGYDVISVIDVLPKEVILISAMFVLLCAVGLVLCVFVNELKFLKCQIRKIRRCLC